MDGGGGDRFAVEVNELVKRYPKRDVNAVDGLSFTVRGGEVFGLLGPNGAGKTTTVGILTTRIRATSGTARLAGIDVLREPVAVRTRLAVVPQQSNLDRALTPRQNLTFHAAYHGLGRAERNRRAAELLDQFGLGGQADVKVNWYSGGMAQRLMIARSLIHEPEVLFLDEPTTGLDPQARLFVWDRIKDMRERGVTIVLTTHDMDEAAELADRVGIVDHGRLLALDTPASLIRRLSGKSVLELTVTPGPADEAGALLAALLLVDGVEKGEQVAAAGPSFGPGGSGMVGGPGMADFPGAGGAGSDGAASGGAASGGAASGGAGAARGGTSGTGAGAGGAGESRAATVGAVKAGDGAALGDEMIVPGGDPAATIGVLTAASGARPGAPPAIRGPVRLRLYLTGDPAALLAPVAVALAARSASLTDVHIGQPSLEDVFIELTGRGLR